MEAPGVTSWLAGIKGAAYAGAETVTPLSQEGGPKRTQKDIETLGGLSRDAIKLLILEHKNSEREHLEPRLHAIEEEARKIVQMVRDGFAKIDTRLTMQDVNSQRQHEENISQGYKRDAATDRLAKTVEDQGSELAIVSRNTVNFKAEKKALDFLGKLLTAAAAAKSVKDVLKMPIVWVVLGPLGGMIGVDIGQSWWYHHHPNGHVQIREITSHIPDAPASQPDAPQIPATPLQSYPGAFPSREKIVGK